MAFIRLLQLLHTIRRRRGFVNHYPEHLFTLEARALAVEKTGRAGSLVNLTPAFVYHTDRCTDEIKTSLTSTNEKPTVCYRMVTFARLGLVGGP